MSPEPGRAQQKVDEKMELLPPKSTEKDGLPEPPSGPDTMKEEDPEYRKFPAGGSDADMIELEPTNKKVLEALGTQKEHLRTMQKEAKSGTCLCSCVVLLYQVLWAIVTTVLFLGLVVPVLLLLAVLTLLGTFFCCSTQFHWLQIAASMSWFTYWYICETRFPRLMPRIHRIPYRLQQLTPEYFTSQLRKTGYLTEDQRVTDVRSTYNVNQGLQSDVFRVILDYDVDDERLPKTMIIKVSQRGFTHRSQLHIVDATWTEMMFWTKIQTMSKGVFNHPTLYFHEFSALSDKFLLAMEVAPGEFIPQGQNLTWEEIVSVTGQVARFHAHWQEKVPILHSWGWPALGKEKLLNSAFDLMLPIGIPKFREFLAAIGMKLPPEVQDCYNWLIEEGPGNLGKFTYKALTNTLVFGDLRDENIYRMENGEFGLIDYQMGQIRFNWEIFQLLICSTNIDEILPRKEELCQHYFAEYSQYYSRVNPGKTMQLTLHELIWQSDFAPFFMVVTQAIAAKSFLEIIENTSTSKDVLGFYRNMMVNTFKHFRHTNFEKVKSVYLRWKALGQPTNDKVSFAELCPPDTFEEPGTLV